MSSTLTTTQLVTIQEQTAAEPPTADTLLKQKRESYTRSLSIEKLKQIYVQHSHIIPNLTSNAEKCYSYLKSMLLICALQEIVESNPKSTRVISEALVVLPAVIQRLNHLIISCLQRQFLIKLVVFLTTTLILLQFLICLVLLTATVTAMSFGLAFLIGCAVIVTKLAIVVMFSNTKEENDTKENDHRKCARRPRLSMAGKTISTVKLF